MNLCTTYQGLLESLCTRCTSFDFRESCDGNISFNVIVLALHSSGGFGQVHAKSKSYRREFAVLYLNIFWL